MSPSRWRKVEEIYQSAQRVPAEERAAFVTAACEGDAELQAEIESLLRYHQKSGVVMDTPAWDLGRDLLASPRLDRGERLGFYEITELIGAGGMGEVYRATDTRLRRTVALKVLPPERLQDTEARRRFIQEARAASALNHPNIVTIHDIASDNGVDFLVMEHVAGRTLDKAIPPGGLRVVDALGYAIQIASAVAAAHAAGVVHRDIKPGNVMIGPEAQLKVLDFGLAKLAARAGGESETVTRASTLTHPGMVVGTVAYMSPEQAMGGELDHRTDIFSIGIVLYEMLAGRRPFIGDSHIAVMHSIVHDDPPPLAGIPPEVSEILVKALAKDLKERYRHAGDLELDLRHVRRGLEAGSLPSMRCAPAPVGPRSGPARWRERLVWVAAIAGVATLAVLVAPRLHRPVPLQPLRFSIVMPPTATWTTLHTLSLSRDGRQLVFVAANPEGNDVLWIRPIDSLESRPIPGTEGASYPFWSPSGHHIGFFDGVSLKKVQAPVDGRIIAPPQVLCGAPEPRGGSWGPNGEILFASNESVYRVPETGGNPEPVLKRLEREQAYSWPEYLPDGKQFLCFVSSPKHKGIHVGSAGSMQFLVASETSAIPAHAGNSDFLLFARGGTLMAQRFEASRVHLAGDAIPITQNVAVDNFGHLAVSASLAGSIAFGTAATPQFWWYDRSGKLLSAVPDTSGFNHPSLSPDEKLIASDGAGPQAGQPHIWMLDVVRGGRWRLTDTPDYEAKPAWTADGRSLVFLNYARRGFYRKSLDGAEELLFSPPGAVDHFSLSPDGSALVYDSPGDQTRLDLWMARLGSGGAAKPAPLLRTAFNEDQPQFSPDGRWLAYESDESGRYEAYVQRFSGGALSPAERHRISLGGGFQPVWRPDGKELFFLSADRKLMSVEVTTGAGRFTAGEPRILFQTNVTGGARVRNHYLVTRDGRRFLVSSPREKANAEPITVIVNWTAALAR